MKQVIRYALFIIVAGIIIFGVGEITNLSREQPKEEPEELIIGEYSGKEIAEKVREVKEQELIMGDEKEVSEQIFWEDAAKGILRNNKEQYKILKQDLKDILKSEEPIGSIRTLRLLLQAINYEMEQDGGWTLEGGVTNENLMKKLIAKFLKSK